MYTAFVLQLFFSLRYQSQLRRTRPKLIHELERSIIESIENFGGSVKLEHKLIYAVFDKSAFCFWLDLLCVVENIKALLDKTSSELYGHIFVLGEDLEEDEILHLSRSLPSELWGTGIWCAADIRKALEPYVNFDRPLGRDHHQGIQGFAQVKELRDSGAETAGTEDNSAKICRYLKQGPMRNTVIAGAEYSGKREGLYRYCSELMGDFPPLMLRFNPEVNAVTAMVDALSPAVREILKEDERFEELTTLGNFLFRERLRNELSDFIVKQGEQFFVLLLDMYRSAAERAGADAVLVLENIQAADPLARFIISSVYGSLPYREKLYLYGTCTGLQTLELWEELFPRIIKFSPAGSPRISSSSLPPDLWELAYACALFGRYFPGYLFQKLLTEEGKNPAMVYRGLTLLAQTGYVGNPEDPAIGVPSFFSRAEKVLGGRAEKVRQLVRNRLLAWVDSGRLSPCFRLLEALSDLGEEPGERLILDAVTDDVNNGTFKGFEKAIAREVLASMVGEGRVPALVFIFKTQKALNHGSSEEIREAFLEPQPADSGIIQPGFRARIFANQAIYSLGSCDTAAASVSVKEAMLITQNENSGRGMDHIYRLFSLVEFANQRLADALDYFDFAVETAGKTGNYGELALIAYYAAGAHFIFGNISKAERLAEQAEASALASGQSGWADRAVFLRGRLRFELGRYQEALDIFKKLEANFSASGTEAFKQVLAAWMFRANTYLHNAGVSHRGGQDAFLFEIEAAFLAGEYRKTLELANSLEKDLSTDRFLFIEQPDWRSGFAQCELMLFPMKDLWERMSRTYRTLALCHISSGESYEREEAIRSLQQIMSEELPEVDPNDSFYYYSCYRVLKRTGAPEVDMNTAVSIAFKRLQRRASHIDNNETRRAFLNYQYWNSALMVAAKEHKLI